MLVLKKRYYALVWVSNSSLTYCYPFPTCTFHVCIAAPLKLRSKRPHFCNVRRRGERPLKPNPPKSVLFHVIVKNKPYNRDKLYVLNCERTIFRRLRRELRGWSLTTRTGTGPRCATSWRTFSRAAPEKTK